MSKFFIVLIDAFKTLVKIPKLFLPKFFIAALYGVLMLLTAPLIVQSLELFSLSREERIVKAFSLLIQSSIIFVFSLLVLILDSLINAMYSVLVRDFIARKNISFIKGFKEALNKFFVIIPAIFIELIFFSILTIPFSLALNLFLPSKNIFLIAVSLIGFLLMVFIANALFFLLFPVSVLEKQNFLQVIFRTFSLTKKNSIDISKASVFPFLVSISSWILSFFADKLEFLFLFILLRFLIAVLATYSYVLNPVFYLAYEKKKKLKHV